MVLTCSCGVNPWLESVLQRNVSSFSAFIEAQTNGVRTSRRSEAVWRTQSPVCCLLCMKRSCFSWVIKLFSFTLKLETARCNRVACQLSKAPTSADLLHKLLVTRSELWDEHFLWEGHMNNASGWVESKLSFLSPWMILSQCFVFWLIPSHTIDPANETSVRMDLCVIWGARVDVNHQKGKVFNQCIEAALLCPTFRFVLKLTKAHGDWAEPERQ